MAARGYTDTTKIALLLDLASAAALTGNQVARLNGGLIEAAEQYIDGYTGRSWLAGGTITAERHSIENGRVWLKHRPITAVTAVRYGGLFESLTLLTVATGYVVNATRGLVTLYGYQRGEVEVDYTVPQTVPADIAEAAGLIAAAWLRSSAAEAGPAGVFKSWSGDGQAFVYRDPALVSEVPVAAQKLLGRYCRQVLV